jgi:copper chaperone CopZ
MKTHVIRIGDIHCIGCVNRITFALESLGATHVDIDLSIHIAKVSTESSVQDEHTFVQAINDTGYQAEYLTTLEED